MDSDKFGLALRTANRMVSEYEKKLKEYIRREQWASAADVKSYISGMEQIITVFELVDNENSSTEQP